MTTVARCPACSSEVRVPQVTRPVTRACPSCNRLLAIRPPPPRQTDPFLGKKFAHYRIGKRIGIGPLAAVYRARNVRDNRTVALKILSDRVGREAADVEDRLVSAVRAAAGVEHPNVLPTFFVGKVDAHLFIEMQYAEDGNIQHLLEQNGHLAPYDAARIIRDAAKGLSAIHAKGILHGGIRPKNLLCMQDGTVKVADAGLLTYDSPASDISASELSYLAPECLTGGVVAPRSDIYSLGATLFILLTGHPPFDAPSKEELLRMFVQDSVPSPQQYVRNLSDELCRLVVKMLDKNPQQRQSDCQELIGDLNRFLEGVQLHPVASRTRGEPVDAALAEPILSDLILSDRTMPAAPRAKRGELQSRSAKMLRQARAKRLRRGFVRGMTRAAAIAAVLAMAYGAYWGIGRLRSAFHARQQRVANEQRAMEAAKLAQKGRDLEMRDMWGAAEEKYARSLDLVDDPDVRDRLETVRQVIKGFTLDKEAKWLEAEGVLRAALSKALARGEITRRLRRVEKGKSYRAAYASAKEAYAKEKWQGASSAFSRAADLASGLRLKTDARELAAKAEQQIAIRERRGALMKGLTDICRKKQDPYALYAACQYYLASEDYRRHHNALEHTLEQAKLALPSSGKKGSPRAGPADGLSTITLHRGGKVRGRIVESNAKALVVEVVEGEKTRRRMFHPSNIADIDPVIPHDVNTHRAEVLCADLRAAREAPRPFEALSKIGQLRVAFTDISFVADPAEQKVRCGATFSDLLVWAVPTCEVMCPDCEYTGSVTCPHCDGKGLRRIRCKECESMARLPLCPKCRGSGLRFTGACSVCSGSGRISCKRCSGKGCQVCSGKGKWTCRACGGKGRALSRRKCGTCNGTGDVSGKTCPKCHGRGKVICLTCKGVGRQACPVCKGERWITIPCEMCSKTGRVECNTCKGTGKKNLP